VRIDSFERPRGTVVKDSGKQAKSYAPKRGNAVSLRNWRITVAIHVRSPALVTATIAASTVTTRDGTGPASFPLLVAVPREVVAGTVQRRGGRLGSSIAPTRIAAPGWTLATVPGACAADGSASEP
jgi:hypothetical protein